jgi:hypothetical protein
MACLLEGGRQLEPHVLSGQRQDPQTHSAGGAGYCESNHLGVLSFESIELR